MNLHYKNLPFQISITVLIVVAEYVNTSAALPMQAVSLTQSVKASDSSISSTRIAAAATAIDAAAIHSSSSSGGKQIKANASETSSGSMYLGHLRSAGGYLWLAFLVVPAATLVGLALVVHNDHSVAAGKESITSRAVSIPFSASTSRAVSIPVSSQRVARSVGHGEGAAQSLLARPMEVGPDTGMSGIPVFFPELVVRDPHGEALILDGELSREHQEGVIQVRRVVDEAVLFEALISETAHAHHKGILIQQGAAGNEVAYVHTFGMTSDGRPCSYIGTNESGPSFAACIRAGMSGWQVMALTPTGTLGKLLLNIIPARGVDELTISDANGALVAVYTQTQRGRYIRLTYGADSIFVVCAALASIKV
jgi:hypothetical protein